MVSDRITLDPQNVENTAQQITAIYGLAAEEQVIVQRIIPLLSRPVDMVVDEALAAQYRNMILSDRFTFNIETDELVLFARNANTIIDGMIEMAMYLAGFLTMMGSDEAWVIEFTIGAWKPVKKRIKRRLAIPVRDRPSGVVGLPPPLDDAPDDDPYPFRTLVSRYDWVSFNQMVMLAARDEITVYFPPETHAKVLAAYVHVRRSMQEVAKGIGIEDYTTFNTRLLDEIQRLEHLFHPSRLVPPDTLPGQDHASTPQQASPNPASQLGLFSSQVDTDDKAHENPFEAFIDQLFPDDDAESDSPPV